jgi:adenylate cyclase
VVVIIAAAALWQFVLRTSHPPVEVASKEKMAFPLPDKPSIAVLPFVNMSDDPKQEFFSDGITEEIITALSKVPRLFVIARNSTFTYKGKPVKVKQVSEELGVRYVLEGSVRKEGDKVRITAQLIDALSGNHLWAERYDRDLKDIFALQDEITLKIIQALQVKLTVGEQARVTGKGTGNLNAYLKTLQAYEQFGRMNKQGSTMAKQLAKEAIALDPQYAPPYTVIGYSHMLDLWFRFSESPEESMRMAVDAAQKALALDNSDPLTHICFSGLYIMQRQHEKAIASAERALELSPSGASAYMSMGTALLYACRFSEAIQHFEQAIRLNPFPASGLIRNLGAAYRAVGRYEDAIVQYKKALQLEPEDLFTHLGLATTYIKLGREKEAQAEAAEVLRTHPKFSLEHYAKTLPLKDQSFADDTIACLRQAGLK